MHCVKYKSRSMKYVHFQGEIDAFQRVSDCLKNNIPIIATVGHGKLADFLKFVVDHFATTQRAPPESESSSKEFQEDVCLCTLDRKRVDTCPDVKYQLQRIYDNCSNADLEHCLSSLSEVI